MCALTICARDINVVFFFFSKILFHYCHVYSVSLLLNHYPNVILYYVKRERKGVDTTLSPRGIATKGTSLAVVFFNALESHMEQ